MKTIKHLLEAKGAGVYTIGPEDSVFQALEMMAHKDVGALVVVSSGRVVGLLSERDYARKVILKGMTSRETKVRDIMSSRVVYIRPDQTVEECLALMTEKRCRHMPVMQEESLVGMVSIGDAVKAIISEREFLIEQLENYILGT